MAQLVVQCKFGAMALCCSMVGLCFEPRQGRDHFFSFRDDAPKFDDGLTDVSISF